MIRTAFPGRAKQLGLLLALCWGLSACAQQARRAPISPGPVQVVLPHDPMPAELQSPAPSLRVPAAVAALAGSGIKVLELQRPGSGLVDITLLMHYPVAGDAAVAGVTAAALARGGRLIHGANVAQRSADLGSALFAHSEAGLAWFTLRVLKVDTAKALQLLAMLVRTPLADRNGIRVAQQRYGLQLMARKSDAGSLAEERLVEVMYAGNDPLARLWPSSEQLAAVSVARVQAFQGRWYHPGQSVLILSGDFAGQALHEVTVAFAGWRPSEHGVRAGMRLNPPVAVRPGLVIEDRPAAAQVEVRLGLPAADIHAPDYPAMRVLVSLLGGGPSGRLFKDLRERQGLTYSVSAQLWRRGLLVISIAMAHDKFAAAVSAVLQHLRLLAQAPPGAEEVKRARSRLVAELALQVETTDDLSTVGIGLARSRLPADFLSALQSRIARVTAADIQRVIEKYLRARPSIVAVGRSRELRRSVRRFLPDLAGSGPG